MPKDISKPIVAYSAVEELLFDSLYAASIAGFDKKSIRRAIASGIKHKGYNWRLA